MTSGRAFGDRRSGTSGAKPEPYLQTPFNELDGSFSSDGRWMAYESDESGAFRCTCGHFRTKAGSGNLEQRGVNPVWSHNGRELFFHTEDNQIMVASYTVKGDSFVADKPRVWSDKRIAGIGYLGNYVSRRTASASPP